MLILSCQPIRPEFGINKSDVASIANLYSLKQASCQIKRRKKRKKKESNLVEYDQNSVYALINFLCSAI